MGVSKFGQEIMDRVIQDYCRREIQAHMTLTIGEKQLRDTVLSKSTICETAKQSLHGTTMEASIQMWVLEVAAVILTGLLTTASFSKAAVGSCQSTFANCLADPYSVFAH